MRNIKHRFKRGDIIINYWASERTVISDYKYPTSIISSTKEHSKGNFFHPTQKPVALLERLIEIFTDKGEVVIDPCAGSGTTLLAAAQTGRRAYGFEIKKNFFADANNKILTHVQPNLF